MNHLKTIISLFIIWYIFSGINQLFYLVIGIICVIITYIIDKQLFKEEQSITISSISLIRSIVYLTYLLKEIINSSLMIVKLLFKSKSLIKTQFNYLLVDNLEQNKLAIYASSITLTPGSVCLEILPNKLLINTLYLESFIELEQQIMVNKIRHL